MKNITNKFIENVVIETSGFPKGKDSIFWSWEAVGKNGVIASDDGLSYEQENSSNVAQFVALTRALEWTVKNMPSTPVRIVSSLELVVKALNNKMKIKKAHLIPLYKNAKRLLTKTNAIVEWQPKTKMRLGH